MGDEIGSGLLSMAVCFDFRSINVVKLSNRNPYFYWFQCHHPLQYYSPIVTHGNIFGLKTCVTMGEYFNNPAYNNPKKLYNSYNINFSEYTGYS